MPALTHDLERVMANAMQLAKKHGNEHATAEHALLALTEDPDAAQVMRACRVDLAVLRSALLQLLDSKPKTLGVDGDPKPAEDFKRVMQRAVLHVQNSGWDKVTGANALVALFSERDCHAVDLLQEQGMSRLDAVNYMSHGIAKAPRHKSSSKAPAPDVFYSTALRGLIERWCDQRHLDALSRVLPGYLALNGLTDGWTDLYESLKSARALGHEAFKPADWDLLNELIRGAERVLYLR